MKPPIFGVAAPSAPIPHAKGPADRAAQCCAIHANAVSRDPAALRPPKPLIWSVRTRPLTPPQEERGQGSPAARPRGVHPHAGERCPSPAAALCATQPTVADSVAGPAPTGPPGARGECGNREQPRNFHSRVHAHGPSELCAPTAPCLQQDLVSSLSTGTEAEKPPPADPDRMAEHTSRLPIVNQPLRTTSGDRGSVAKAVPACIHACMHSAASCSQPPFSAFPPKADAPLKHTVQSRICTQRTQKLHSNAVMREKVCGSLRTMFRRYQRSLRLRKANPSHRSCSSSTPLTDTQQLRAETIETTQNNVETSCEEHVASLCAVHAAPASAAATCEKRVLQEYRDVFPDQLPAGLPPSRDVDHPIELTPGAVPPSRPTYPPERQRDGRAEEAAGGADGRRVHSAEQVAIRRADLIRQEEGRHHAHVRRLPRAEQRDRQEQLPAAAYRRAVRPAARAPATSARSICAAATTRFASNQKTCPRLRSARATATSNSSCCPSVSPTRRRPSCI